MTTNRAINLTKSRVNRSWIVPIFVFVFMFVFYTQIHPVIIFDTDDWAYNSFTRHPIPLWKAWNPTRVLAEVLMPTVAQIGSTILYPINHDFIISNTISHAFVISVFIAVYIKSFYKYISLYFDEDQYSFKATFTTLLFFICHFLIFRSQYEYNTHMFIANDQCVFYYYVIPNMINSSLALYYLTIRHPNNTTENQQHFTPWFVIVIYFAAFSNLFASCIYAAVLGIYLIYDLIIALQKKAKISLVLKQDCINILFLSIWSMVQIFEMNGMRAASLSQEESVFSLFKKQSFHLWDLIKTVNRPFAVSCILIIILTGMIILFSSSGKKHISTLLLIVATEIPTVIYLVLVSSQQALGGIKRPEISFGIFMFGFVFIFSLLAITLSKLQLVNTLLPLLCILSTFETNTTQTTFKENNFMNITYESVYAMDTDIIRQVEEADNSHQPQLDLYVPKFNDGDNFPVAVYAGDYISWTVRKNNITGSSVSINIVPTPLKNTEFGIN